MGRFLPDVAITVDDKEAAARYFAEVFGLARGRDSEEWIEMEAGPFRIYLTSDEPKASTMFAYATEDVASVVEKIVSLGGEILGESGTEVFVQDRYGVSYCIEPKSD